MKRSRTFVIKSLTARSILTCENSGCDGRDRLFSKAEVGEFRVTTFDPVCCGTGSTSIGSSCSFCAWSSGALEVSSAGSAASFKPEKDSGGNRLEIRFSYILYINPVSIAEGLTRLILLSCRGTGDNDGCLA